MKRIFFTIFFLISVFSFGQKKAGDTLFLMNGRMVATQVIDTLFNFATFVDPGDSTKRSHIENDQLFAIKYQSGDIFYYYEQDTIANWFSREEMWMFMQGERDARKGFKPHGSFYGTMTAGILGGLTGTFFAPIAPLAYFAFVGIPWVRIKHKTVSNANNLTFDSYILGYEREARKKRRLHSLIGGAIGLAAGFAGYAAFNQYYPNQIIFTNGKFEIIH